MRTMQTSVLQKSLPRYIRPKGLQTYVESKELPLLLENEMNKFLMGIDENWFKIDMIMFQTHILTACLSGAAILAAKELPLRLARPGAVSGPRASVEKHDG